MSNHSSPKREALQSVKEAYNAYLEREISYEQYLEVVVAAHRVEGVTSKSIEAAKDQALQERQKSRTKHS